MHKVKSSLAPKNFYLKPCQEECTSFNGQWFYARLYAERSLKTLFKLICENVEIEIAVQDLKELGYSDSIVISITRHKTQQRLYSYEQSKSVLQHEGLSGFLNALEIVEKSSNLIEVLPNESFSEHNEDNIELHDTDNIESHDTDNIEPHNMIKLNLIMQKILVLKILFI
ncbi:5896_t:CDS:2 [Gigaspora rosea]|nr:5896_t:CDS:2 [Gigaspora rosea]